VLGWVANAVDHIDWECALDDIGNHKSSLPNGDDLPLLRYCIDRLEGSHESRRVFSFRMLIKKWGARDG
jgi:hypothetical protein